VYPYASLKPARELLRNRVQTGDGNEDSEKQWHLDWSNAVDNASLEMRVLMGHIESSFGEIEEMQVGNVLYFKKPDSAKLLINGIPAFEAQVGSMGTQAAVLVERPIIPDLQ
jgi:flagellar motor switch protein FliM